MHPKRAQFSRVWQSAKFSTRVGGSHNDAHVLHAREPKKIKYLTTQVPVIFAEVFSERLLYFQLNHRGPGTFVKTKRKKGDITRRSGGKFLNVPVQKCARQKSKDEAKISQAATTMSDERERSPRLLLLSITKKVPFYIAFFKFSQFLVDAARSRASLGRHNMGEKTSARESNC